MIPLNAGGLAPDNHKGDIMLHIRETILDVIPDDETIRLTDLMHLLRDKMSARR